MTAILFSQWKIVALAALVVLLGFQQLRVSGAQAEAAQARAALSADRQRYAEDTRKAEQDQRKIEGDRLKENERIAHEARNQVARAQADARDAAAAASGLRRQVAALLAARSAAGASPGAAPGGTPAGDVAPLFSDLFLAASDRARELAAEADRRGVAGSACVAAFDALHNEVSP